MYNFSISTLSNKINILYNFVYKHALYDKLQLYNVSLGNISIIDIKKSYSDNNQEEYNEVFINKDNYELILHNSNYILLLSTNKKLPILLKISIYTSNENILDNSVNNDSLFSFILSNFSIQYNIPHILISVANVDMRIKQLKDILDNKTYESLMTKFYQEKNSNMCCCQIREAFYSTLTLKQFLLESKKNNINLIIKQFLIQVLFTIALIQSKIDNFRHNALILDNILVNRIEPSSITYDLSELNNSYISKHQRIQLKNLIFYIKITNFEYSVIPKFYGLFNLDNKDIPFPETTNNYYDVYTLLNSLITFIDEAKITINSELRTFLDTYVPSKIRNNFTKNYNLFEIKNIICDNYFKEFYIDNMNTNSDFDKKINESNLQVFGIIRNKDSTSKVPSHRSDKKLSNKKNKKTSQRSKHNSDKNKRYNSINNLEFTRILNNEIWDNKIHKKSIRYNITQFKNHKLSKKYNHVSDSDISDSNTLQKGGALETNPYKEEINNPFTTNESKKLEMIETEKTKHHDKSKGSDKYVDKAGDKPGDKSTIPDYQQSIIPLYNTSGMLINPNIPYTNIINKQPPIQKVYNVNLANPLGGMNTLNKIYEDSLPFDKTVYSFITVYERMEIINHIRNIMINNNDGEVMNISAGDNSLLSYIKVLNINPYTINPNPFTDLPNNFLLYKAAYPIRFNESSRLLQIADHATGINVRIYMLSWGDLNCLHIKSNTSTKLLDEDSFDIWREIKYYKWVKDKILKRHISPNFIAPILYKIDTQSQIDWSILTNLKFKYTPKYKLYSYISNEQQVNNDHDLKSLGLSHFFKDTRYNKTPKQIYKILQDYFNPTYRRSEDILEESLEQSLTLENMIKLIETKKFKITDVIEHLNNYVNKNNISISRIGEIQKLILQLSKYIKDDITQNSGSVLVLLTEAPTTGFTQWMCPIYNSTGSIKKMISTGYHSCNVWKTIIFQLLYIFAILQKEQFLFINMTIDNNLYVKDVNTDPNNVGHWVYKINDLNYYIPNYGYILLFDSKNTDIDNINSTEASEKTYKIYNNMLYSNNIDNYAKIFNDKFKEIINPNNFLPNIIKKKNAIPPDDTIVELLNKIYHNIEEDITQLIFVYFQEYLHNRIGTSLYKSEKENVNLNFITDFSRLKGKLVVWQKRSDEYVWVLYYNDVTVNNIPKKQIITKENNIFIKYDVFIGCLFAYPENERIMLDISRGSKLEEYLILENYSFDDL